mmetsp:Transcript_5228/g.10311  ORF Transcript_5228/g.10311 Transcript_5228/m.10311 type:complete len:247 (-) Transcript_5228:167-907(-)
MKLLQSSQSRPRSSHLLQALASMDESVRSVDSQSSTIPVNHPENSLHKKLKPQQQISFDMAHIETIKPAPCAKHVRFVDAENEIVPPLYSSPYRIKPLWYTNADYKRFKQETSELCQHFGNRPWFQHLQDVYDEQQHQQGEIRRSLENDVRLPPQHVIEALYLGLDFWIVPTGRRARRQALWITMESIQQQQQQQQQQTNQSFLQIQRQLQEASLAQSHPAMQQAVYLAQQVAASVRDEQQNDSDE